MKIPTRPAPSVPRNEPSRENFYQSNKPVGQVKPKKKPPPRPPPPKFNRKPDFTTSLIDLSAPLEDYLQAANANQDLLKQFSDDDFFKSKSKPSANNDFFKAMSSSNNDYSKPKPNGNDEFFKRKPPLSLGNSSFFGSSTVNVNHLDLATGTSSSISEAVGPRTNVVAPTIIRAQTKAKKDFVTFQVNNVSRRDLESNNYSPPMPTIPPPSPPKYVYDTDTQSTVPHGVALYSYTASHKDDLPLQVDDVVILLRQVNDEWFYGRIDEKEGIFPANFIDIRVPLPDLNIHFVTALYEFNPETHEDLKLLPGQRIKVLKRISQEWLYGESNGNFGQFPSNFVDRIPTNI